MSPHPGEIWLADLGLAAKTRPVVIVSRYDPDAPRALLLYVPLTSQNRASRYEVELPRLQFLKSESVANVQGIGSLRGDATGEEVRQTAGRSAAKDL